MSPSTVVATRRMPAATPSPMLNAPPSARTGTASLVRRELPILRGALVKRPIVAQRGPESAGLPEVADIDVEILVGYRRGIVGMVAEEPAQIFALAAGDEHLRHIGSGVEGEVPQAEAGLREADEILQPEARQQHVEDGQRDDAVAPSGRDRIAGRRAEIMSDDVRASDADVVEKPHDVAANRPRVVADGRLRRVRRSHAGPAQ